MIPAVNYHLWEPCNMRCQFCFATFQDVKQTILPKGHLPKEQAIDVIKNLALAGFEKITFAGGEPTLCPWINDLIKEAKIMGLTTMIVTNGSKLTDDFLKANHGKLDWITLSVDSLDDATNIQTGRAISGKKSTSKQDYYELVAKIKSYGYGLKINTVVTYANVDEIMIDFIEFAQPKRWKLFQVLPIKGQNDYKVDSLLINDQQFNYFIERNKTTNNTIQIVPEYNDQMMGSYVMVDPAGRFFDNSTGTHLYSKPINEVGCANAIQEMNYDIIKFKKREGFYDWNRTSKAA
ncbi:viperin family antiviral radical SAM protein [Flavobacterium sp. SUN046]|uniref:viperin family antiviral radical SAM protein n=1 Tax=Flavobacterium sp. SUN046 TaxID=3002440 RepID=UPI002DB65146|nr:viperin family antiviral radical SAM protein [Flavobacterium sp. SUN046]MEC4049110.1 viperin family antiviral radical SAM protein [Flavobacterium sp. SUN046]